MARHQQHTPIEQVLELLTVQDTGGFIEAIRIFIECCHVRLIPVAG
jgi:hypothetical protein